MAQENTFIHFTPLTSFAADSLSLILADIQPLALMHSVVVDTQGVQVESRRRPLSWRLAV